MRILAIQTVVLAACAAALPTHAAAGEPYNTRRAIIHLNDPSADVNPVRRFEASKWLAYEVKGKVQPKRSQNVALLCEGDIRERNSAQDIFQLNGDFNDRFKVTPSTTVMDLCNQSEDYWRRKNPALFR